MEEFNENNSEDTAFCLGDLGGHISGSLENKSVIVAKNSIT